jgi:hypothetical protein
MVPKPFLGNVERNVRIVAKDQDTRSRGVLRQEIFWPKFPVCVRPCCFFMIRMINGVEAMDEYDANWVEANDVSIVIGDLK